MSAAHPTLDLAQAYAAAHGAAVQIDRSGEGRLILTERDRLAILHRISTNDVESLAPGEGRATVLTTPIGRTIDRVIAHALSGERVLLRTSPGRSVDVAVYLRRNVFFRDKLKIEDATPTLAQIALVGPGADTAAADLAAGLDLLPLHGVIEVEFRGAPLWIARLDPPGVPGLGLILAADQADALRGALGVPSAGPDLYALLRVEAAVPGPPELNESYLPLEAALWADVSFTKGCYTGQEIIARMESRGRLAKTLVGVDLSGPVEAGSAWHADGRRQGELTSTAALPDGRWIGLGFVRPDLAEPGRVLTFEGGASAVVRATPERQPPANIL